MDSYKHRVLQYEYNAVSAILSENIFSVIKLQDQNPCKDYDAL